MLSVEGQAQPFTNLSAGQRMMVALVADVATKVVMQNSHLVSDVPPSGRDVPPVLQRPAASFAVFDQHIDVKLALIDAFPGTAASCFDEGATLVDRPGSDI